ncbi:MAG: DUF4388 domain-containing protein [Candidatus Krumholzibacteriota bacterium]|nr:DUF4388 domain-containing protein [Candidatus Krumholzibacteriota bacterium]
MALEGNAKDFGLSEIFQLISIQKKSGMLSVNADSNAAIFFKDGLIISTRDRRNRSKDPLKDYLLKYGFISRDKMNNLQQIQSESNMDLTEILLSEKYFSEDELTEIFTEQIYESVQEVLSWPRSHYKFIIGKNILSGVRSFSAIKVEGVLMESMRRIDEMPEMKRIFSSESMRFSRLPFPAERGFSISRNEEVLYELLETERTLEYLITNSRMARFTTYESLKLLLEKGMLEIKEDHAADRIEVSEHIPELKVKNRSAVMPTFVTLVVLIAGFAIGEYLVPFLSPPGWTAASVTMPLKTGKNMGLESAENMTELKMRLLEAKVIEALEEYAATSGTYPFTLEVLAARKIIPGRIIDRVQQAGMIYKTNESGRSYSLVRN